MTNQLQGAMRALLVAAIGCGAAGVAMAQQGQRGQGSLPFSSTYRRPTVSPYMQMAQQGLNPMQGQGAYQTLVQPQLQQQQQQIEQLQQARQLNKIQNQVQQIQRDTSARQVDESIRPTGHRATFQNLSHFYPQTR
jgi:acetyl-CoA carboxylase carboxyltransferase component